MALRCLPVLLVAAGLALPPPASAAAPNTWTRGPAMAQIRVYATTATLADGRLLVAGGVPASDNEHFPRDTTPLVEVFDPRRDRWSSGGSPAMDSQAIGITVVADGRLLAKGSRGPPQAALSDLASRSWTATAAPPIFGDVIALRDGRALTVRLALDGNPAAASVYDPARDTWSAAEPTGGASSPLVRLADGRVAAFGGQPGVFDPATGSWAALTARSCRSPITEAMSYDARRVLVSGSAFHDLYDPATGTCQRVSETPAQMVPLRDGRLLEIYSDPPIARIFDLARGRSFRAAAPRATGAGAFLVPLADGRVMRGGGIVCESGPSSPCTSITVKTQASELYQPPPARPVISRLTVTGGGRSARFTLNEAATVRLVIERRMRGAWRTVRSSRRPAHPGSNRVALSGRLDVSHLPAGRYRVKLFSRDPFDRTGVRVLASFRLS